MERVEIPKSMEVTSLWGVETEEFANMIVDALNKLEKDEENLREF